MYSFVMFNSFVDTSLTIGKNRLIKIVQNSTKVTADLFLQLVAGGGPFEKSGKS